MTNIEYDDEAFLRERYEFCARHAIQIMEWLNNDWLTDTEVRRLFRMQRRNQRNARNVRYWLRGQL